MVSTQRTATDYDPTIIASGPVPDWAKPRRPKLSRPASPVSHPAFEIVRTGLNNPLYDPENNKFTIGAVTSLPTLCSRCGISLGQGGVYAGAHEFKLFDAKAAGLVDHYSTGHTIARCDAVRAYNLEQNTLTLRQAAAAKATQSVRSKLYGPDGRPIR